MKINSKNESIEIIKLINTIFLKKRGFVVQEPKKNSNVILLLSGGLDSISAWQILMDKYQVNVYPLVIKKNTLPNNEVKSIDHFSKKFKKQYPKFYNPPFFIGDPRKEQLKILKRYFNTKSFIENKDEFILEYLSKEIPTKEVFGQTTTYAIHAYDYAQLLEKNNKTKINHIVTANLKSDGKLVKHQTLTSIRTTNLLLCSLSKNWKIQFYSIFAEPQINILLEKDELIQKVKSNSTVNLNKTWSCDNNYLLHCGKCVNCIKRKEAFQKSSTPDKTIYLDDLIKHLKKFLKRIQGKIKYEYKKIFHTKQRTAKKK